MIRNYARNKGSTSYRPEQFKLQELFKVYAPSLRIEMEYPVKVGHEIVAIGDLVDLDNRIVWRLNGESHQGRRRFVKDPNQKVWLETLGWKVEDVEKDSFEWNWLWI